MKQQLADKYKKRAEEIEMQGYHRLANTLRELAKSYEQDAESQSNNNF